MMQPHRLPYSLAGYYITAEDSLHNNIADNATA